MNAIAEENATQTDSAKDQEGAAGGRVHNAQADTPTDDSEATSVAVGAATDAAVDSAATTNSDILKPIGRLLDAGAAISGWREGKE